MIGDKLLEPDRPRCSAAETGADRPRERFELDRAADAHAAIESRATIGKTLMVVSGPR